MAFLQRWHFPYYMSPLIMLPSRHRRIREACACVRRPPRMRANMCRVCRVCRDCIALNSDIQPHAHTHTYTQIHATPLPDTVTFDLCQCEPWKSAIFNRSCQQGAVGVCLTYVSFLSSTWAPVQLVWRSANHSALVGRKGLQGGSISIRCHHTPDLICKQLSNNTCGDQFNYNITRYSFFSWKEVIHWCISHTPVSTDVLTTACLQSRFDDAWNPEVKMCKPKITTYAGHQL